MRELRPGDNIVYLFDRERVTDAEVDKIANPVLKQMAADWRQQYTHRFFLTVARNYQPIPGTSMNTFASHDDSVLFIDKATLLENLPRLGQFAGGAGFVWVLFATRDIEDAARAVLEPS
jgi:hypothetical protein